MDNKIELVKDMKKSYLDYAMSVIVGRALPDVRDGLKPVHRRILFSMSELGITYDKPYKKCARTVGDVLGKYHPHGDTSVYDALVRLAQDFVMRYPLIDGHGNFGSQDGDGAAAMRYTESRLANISNQMIRDINKDTIDFMPNFDGEETEPTILPSRIPNLLVNGSTGIAVGVATNIPPHNLKDTIDSIIYQIDNPNCGIDELVNIIKAPDFPTKAIIVNPEEVKQIYSEGKGKIVIRGRYHIETIKKQKIIVFTEIPYGVNRAYLKDKLYDLINGYTKKVKEGKKTKDVFVPPIIPQIVEMKDDSDVRVGTRLMFVLKNNADENIALSLLFKNCDLQFNFNANFTAVKGNLLYEKMSLKDMNYHYIEHQKEVLTRRTNFELTKAEKRIHILEGLKIAIANMKKVIDIVERSKNKKDSIDNLIKELKFTEIQATSVVELRIYKLSGMEIEDINKEYKELTKSIKYLNKILNSENELLNLLKTELIEIRDKYGDERKTEIIYEDTLQEISSDDLVEDYLVTLVRSSENYFKKNKKYSEQQKVKDGDTVVDIIQANNRDKVIFITNKGNGYILNIDSCNCKLPSELGDYLPSVLPLESTESVIGMITTNSYAGHVLIAFDDGHVVKIPMESYKTKTNRTKLSNCLSDCGQPILITQINEDCDLELTNSFGKTVTINTKDISEKKLRSSNGITVMSSKRKGFKVISAKIL